MSDTMAYIAREPECGCVTVAMVDSEQAKRENARELAMCVRSGMTIERIPVEEARPLITSCPHWKINSRNKRRRTEVPA